MRIKRSDIKNLTAEQALKIMFRRVKNEIITSGDSDSVMLELSKSNKRNSGKKLNGN